MIEFKMPSLGADMEAGTLVEWLVKPGDIVKRGDIIAVVDTQKGLIDIEVFDEGTISSLQVKEQEKVPVGTLLALITGSKKAVEKEEAIAPAKISEEKEAVEAVIIPERHHGIKASPLAKRIAAEKGIELTGLHGTGEGGAITKEDVERAIVERMAPEVKKAVPGTGAPEGVEIEKGSEAKEIAPKAVTKVEMKSASTESIRMAVAAAMSKSNREIPHYYLETKVDMSKALAWLGEANKQRTLRQRLLPVVLLLKAVAKALTDVPSLNGYWNNGLQIKNEINIGFVVSLRTGGVMIPAIAGAGQKTIDELMAALNDVIPRARAMKLRSSELSESTVTVTSLGEGNVEKVYGVIYPPQLAIVGFGSITEQPWAERGMLDVRPVITVTLSADHRATDGATGSRFLMAIKNYLGQPELLYR